ncbi:DUF4407 domain-containing protein [Reyranella sp.]|uniref:DUF4407 domain-containing protein n=1 Tax=Reyranella sp. TaxID=1929291 RepID=UPI003BAC8F31
MDPVALEDCPGTDRIWAAQVGFSLVLNFVVVFGLTYYAVGYFLGELYVRIFVALLVAAVLTSFDRALFQFDWFTVALLQEAREGESRSGTFLQRVAAFGRPMLRLSLRLAISLAIAYTLSVFVELAAFDEAIRERMAIANYADNEPYRQKVAAFEKGLDEQAAQRRAAIGRVEGEIVSLQRGFVSHTAQDEYDALRRSAVDARTRVAATERTVADNEKRIGELNQDIYAERYGLKDKPHRTGRPGCEPNSVCYSLVLTVKEMRETNEKLLKEIDSLRAEAAEFDARASDLARRRSAADSELVASMRRDLETLREEASAAEARRPDLVAGYQAQLRQDGTYRPLRDDPIIRLGILNELRRDPVRGQAFTEMSYLIRAFIAFLELAPVLAKIFFAPPTVYSARIRAAIVQGQSRALREARDPVGALPFGVIDVYGVNEPANVALLANDHGRRAPALADAQPSMIAIPRGGAAAEPLPRSGFGAVEQLAVSRLAEWIGAEPDHRRAAGEYYAARLAEGRLFIDSDMAVVDYSREHFPRDTRFFELGFGFGELSLCLALSGFRTVGFESDAGRHEAACALAAAVAGEGYDTGELSLVYGLFPDVLRLDGGGLAGESVLVSTNVTSSLMMAAIDKVIWSLRLFDHLIIDLARFGEVRDASSQRALVDRLQEIGFSETARVYEAGDTDVRHFARRVRAHDH